MRAKAKSAGAFCLGTFFWGWVYARGAACLRVFACVCVYFWSSAVLSVCFWVIFLRERRSGDFGKNNQRFKILFLAGKNGNKSGLESQVINQLAFGLDKYFLFYQNAFF